MSNKTVKTLIPVVSALIVITLFLLIAILASDSPFNPFYKVSTGESSPAAEALPPAENGLPGNWDPGTDCFNDSPGSWIRRRDQGYPVLMNLNIPDRTSRADAPALMSTTMTIFRNCFSR